MEKIAEHESDYKFHLEMTIDHSLTLSQEINKLKASLDVSVAAIMDVTRDDCNYIDDAGEWKDEQMRKIRDDDDSEFTTDVN